MKIQVTQKHIDAGVRGSCSSDPICLALKDAGFKNPWVSPDRITGIGGGIGFGNKAWPTPRNVYVFMVEYDNGKPVFPFEFELEEE